MTEALFLGLDASKFRQGSSGPSADDWGFVSSTQLPDAERFKECERLVVRRNIGDDEGVPVAGVYDYGANGIAGNDAPPAVFWRDLQLRRKS